RRWRRPRSAGWARPRRSPSAASSATGRRRRRCSDDGRRRVRGPAGARAPDDLEVRDGVLRNARRRLRPDLPVAVHGRPVRLRPAPDPRRAARRRAASPRRQEGMGRDVGGRQGQPEDRSVDPAARPRRSDTIEDQMPGAVVTFTLDGREVSAPEGELLVHALARHGVFVPTLCHDEKLDPYGGCRMCVVAVEGSPRPLPACATRVTEGMAISTDSAVPGFQRTLTELLELAEDLGVEAPLTLPDAKREPYEDRDRLMGYDPDACILCARCVRYTQEVMQCSALSLEGRGAEARVVPTWGRSWLDTECEL